jgi:hypothetical protein
MNHLTEEQLILHYYGEDPGEPAGAEHDPVGALAIEQHLDDCAACRSLYGSLQRVLNIVDAMPVPERPADYGAQVWQRISGNLPARGRGLPRFLSSPWRWAAVGAAMAGLLVTAFIAGRFYAPGRPVHPQVAVTGIAPDIRRSQEVDDRVQGSERVLRAAVGDYLERSQMVLVELVNADPKTKMDITDEKERADDLVTETRLYRQTATRTGDTRIAALLDELERVLVDIRNSPSEVTPQELDGFRKRLESDGILFKIRVLGSNVRNQEQQPAAPTSGQTL